MIIAIYNEIIVVLSFASTLLINCFSFPSVLIDILGMGIILLIIGALGLTWVNSFTLLIKDMIKKVKEFLSKKKNPVAKKGSKSQEGQLNRITIGKKNTRKRNNSFEDVLKI